MSKKKSKKSTSTKQGSQRRPRRWVLLCGIFFIVAMGATVSVFVFRSNETSQENVLSQCEQAKELFEQERYQEAHEVLHEVRQFLKDDPEALKLYAKTCLQLPAEGNTHVSTAIAVFRRCLKLTPNDPELLDYLADLYHRTGATEFAIDFARQALERNPEKSEKYLAIIATESLNDRKFQQAIEAADQWLQANPLESRPYEVRLAGMRSLGKSSQEIEEWMSQIPVEMKGIVQLQQANLQSDREETQSSINALLKQPPKSNKQLSYVVAKLEQAGRRDDAIELIENQLETANDKNLERELVFRYWQRGYLTKLTDRFAKEESLTDEYQVLYCLGLIYQNRIDEAKIQVEKLDANSSRLARVWKDVLIHSVGTIDDGQDLLAACDRAIQSFPSLAYLVNHRALACEMVGETELAIATYEKALRLAPRWYAPRVALARLNYAQGNYRAAFEAASSALKINGRQPAMVELATSSALEWVASGDSIPAALQSEISKTLNRLQEHSKNQVARELVATAQTRVTGNRQQTDRKIAKLVEQTPDLSQQQLRLLYKMASESTLRDQLAEKLAKVQRKNTFQLISTAKSITSKQGIEKGLTFLDQYEFQGEKPSELIVNVAKAELLTSVGDSRAKQAWIQLAKKNPSNPKVIDLVLGSETLKDDLEARKDIVDSLKKQTNGKGVTWRLEKARLLLAAQEKKQAAEAALMLNEIVEEAPKYGDAYYLLAVSHDQLGNPQKSIQVLQSAVAAGIDQPWLYIDLAERFGVAERKSETIHFAKTAGEDRRSTMEIRQRAVKLLLQFDACDQAVQLLERDMPKQLIDRDEDFALASVYSVSAARIGDHDKAENAVWPMTEKSARWLELWIDLAILPSNELELSKKWLQRAETRIADRDDSRRQLAIAWGRLSQQAKQPALAVEGCRLIKPLVGKSDRDQLLQALLFQRAGQSDSAIEVYESMLAKNGKSALLLNNLGMLLAKDSKTAERGEQMVREALELEHRHEYVDSLAKVYLRQDRRADAIKLIGKHLESFRNQPGLGIQLAELQYAEGDSTKAMETLTRVESSDSAKANMSLDHWNRINALKKKIDDEKISKSLPSDN